MFRRFVFRNLSSDVPEDGIAARLHALFEQMRVVSPSIPQVLGAFIATFLERHRSFEPGMQHDTDEIWHSLIDTLDREIRQTQALVLKKRVGLSALRERCETEWHRHMTSVMVAISHGLRVGQVRCHSCGNTEERCEPFAALGLELPQQETVTMEELLVSQSPASQLEDWRCDRCHKQDAKLGTRVWRSPLMLAITLKRFQVDPKTFQLRKNTINVRISERLDLSPLVLPVDDERPEQTEYRLRGIACHMGGLSSGHYFAAVNNGSSWYLIDDDAVSRHERLLEHVGQAAYMLFYDRV